MTYIEGFVAAVPKANKEAYLKHAADAASIFQEFGVRRHIEAWGDDVTEGKTTDFRKAVNAKDDEEVVFAWFEYPDKATRDAVNKRMQTDPRMKEMGETMPFDGKRMIYGGFDAIVEEGNERGNYVDGFIVPVPEGKLDAYTQLAQKMAGVFREHGALRDLEAVNDDVPKGEVTDFYRAVKAEEGERVVFSFLEWPDKATRDSGWQKIMADESLKPEGDMPFSGPRMFWGGFQPIFDTAKQTAGQPTERTTQPA
jgi:uncharacterized protein YbaA (DUF1428 family)